MRAWLWQTRNPFIFCTVAATRTTIAEPKTQLQKPPSIQHDPLGLFMTVTISIPTALRAYTDNQASITVDAVTVNDALNALSEKHPTLQPYLRDDTGNIRHFLNVYLNDENIRFLDEQARTPLKHGDSLIIVPSIAGG